MEPIQVNCEAARSANLAERYVLGQLSEPDLTSFEEHYYVCDRCLEEVRLLQALQSAAAVQPRPAARHPAPPKFAWVAIAAALIAVVGLTTLALLRRKPVQPVPVAIVAPPSGAPGANSAALQLLARAEPPRYIPSKLRGAPGASADAFRAAMELYSHGDYGAAAEALRPLATPSPDAAAPLFYLGICDLMTGNAPAAAVELRRVEALGDTPYLEPARFFLAKALLAKEDVAGAAAALELTIQLKGDRETEARQLLARLRALPTAR
jgi:TolA-binding protein